MAANFLQTTKPTASLQVRRKKVAYSRSYLKTGAQRHRMQQSQAITLCLLR